MKTQTKFPVVLLHGVFGYGRSHPAWGYFPPYWPEQHLADLNANHIIVDVGTASSDHDRACEAFYQLVGGTVDYGEQHAQHTTHARYGETFDTPLHPNWSAEHPIHLVGHSLGALTALELYQLVSHDFFNVGSDHRWVRSITSIAGPLTGSTLAHMAGLDDATASMPVGSPAHVLYIVLGVWGKVYMALPMLRGAYDLRMDQWKHLTLRQLCSVSGPVNQSMDSGFYSILPARRVALNAQLTHMDKLHLLSIVTSPTTCHVPVAEVATFGALLLVLWSGRDGRSSLSRTASRWLPALLLRFRYVRSVCAAALALALYRQVQRLDIAKLPSLYALKWLMRRTAKALPSQLFDGYDAGHWEHNDGAVNIRSQLRPWFPKPKELSTATATDHMDPHTRSLPATGTAALTSATALPPPLARCDSHISIRDFDRERSDADADAVAADAAAAAAERFVKGRWYVYRVNSNHFTGTHWDREARNLYKSLFVQIANEYEGDSDGDSVDDDDAATQVEDDGSSGRE